MTLTNAYTTTALVRAGVDIPATDTSEDIPIEAAIASASRQVDAHCGGRRFWQDATVVTRTYVATDDRILCVDDISTTTGLIVKTDTNGDGTYGTTLAITTNFLLWPTNAGAQYPVEPWTEIHLVDFGATYFPMWSSGRPGVQVTAKFGWAAVPDAVAMATLIQAIHVYKSPDAVFGMIQMGDGYASRLRSQMHPTAEALLEDFVRQDPVS